MFNTRTHSHTHAHTHRYIKAQVSSQPASTFFTMETRDLPERCPKPPRTSVRNWPHPGCTALFLTLPRPAIQGRTPAQRLGRRESGVGRPIRLVCLVGDHRAHRQARRDSVNSLSLGQRLRRQEHLLQATVPRVWRQAGWLRHRSTQIPLPVPKMSYSPPHCAHLEGTHRRT